MDFETYRIANRHLSESQLRDSYANRTSQDSRDVDERLRQERQERKSHYGKIDSY